MTADLVAFSRAHSRAASIELCGCSTAASLQLAKLGSEQMDEGIIVLLSSGGRELEGGKQMGALFYRARPSDARPQLHWAPGTRMQICRPNCGRHTKRQRAGGGARRRRRLLIARPQIVFSSRCPSAVGAVGPTNICSREESNQRESKRERFDLSAARQSSALAAAPNRLWRLCNPLKWRSAAGGRRAD